MCTPVYYVNVCTTIERYRCPANLPKYQRNIQKRVISPNLRIFFRHAFGIRSLGSFHFHSHFQFRVPRNDRRQGSSFSNRTLGNFLQRSLSLFLFLFFPLLKRDHDKKDTEKIRLARFEIRKCSYRGEGGEGGEWWWSLLRSSKYLSTI